MIVRWGHFSDLHFKDWGGFTTNLLKKKLPEALGENNVKFDYMFITGDIFHKGVFDAEIKDFINEIASVAECDKENIIICPGNHDGERTEIRKMVLDRFISKREENPNVEMDEEFYNTLVSVPFKGFIESYESIIDRKPQSILHYTKKLNHINLYVLNTAVFAGQTYPRKEEWTKEEQSREDKNLYICDSKLFELEKLAKNDGFSDSDLTLVIGHHGIECFTDEEQKRLKAFIDEQKIDLYLCGHVHTNTNKEIEETDCIRQVSCGGLFSGDYVEPSFIIGEYNSDNNNVTLTNYAFDSKLQWAKNTAANNPYHHGVHSYIPQKFVGLPHVCTPSKYDGQALYEISKKRYEQTDTSPSKSIIHAIKKDVEDVKEIFYGYEIELEKLKSLVEHNGYVYVHGQQLFGKTYLISKLIYDISTQDDFSTDFSGHPIPWIHKCFVVIGKRASSKDRGIEMLIEQANAVLCEPVKLEKRDYDKYGFSSIMQKLSKELEHVTVIFDALDEMGMDDLELFTEPLPDNCTVILSSKTKLAKSEKNIENPKSIDLQGFKENDILKILNRNKKEPNVTRFVNFLMNKTKGNPCFILDIAKKIKENNNEIPNNYPEAYKYVTSLENFFANFKKLWLSEPVLKELLKMFAVFERIDYLTVEHMQAYLLSIGKPVDSDSINQLLSLVINQLDTNDDGRYKLKYNAFVGYLIKKYTAADFKMVFDSVSDLLISEKNYEHLGLLFLNWNLQKEIDEEKTEIITKKSDEILDALIENKIIANSSIIQAMCAIVKRDSEMQPRLHSYIIKCFDTLEEKDDYNIISAYFDYSYGISDTNEAKKEAVNYIKKLADQGNKGAALCYAELIAYGDIYTEKNVDMAIHYLKISGEDFRSVGRLYNIYNHEKKDKTLRNEYLDKLIKCENAAAQCVYASHLATGSVYKKDVHKSCEIFDRLIAEKNLDAMVHKANLISSGKLDNCKIEEAFDLWDKVSKQTPVGYFEKGKYLYNNNKQQKGYSLIKEAFEKGSIEASLFIAQYNLDNNKNYSADLVNRLNKILTMSRKENRRAAELLYGGNKEKLIKNYSAYNLSDLYTFAYETVEPTVIIEQSFEYYSEKNYQKAFAGFEKVFLESDSGGAVNMAYMLRRKEVESDKYTVQELLAPLVDANNSLAVMNCILEIIKNSNNQKDFDTALELLKKLDASDKDYETMIAWWQNIASQNDSEGDLVLGMLLYAGKLEKDPDGKNVQKRLKTASAAGYEIAGYMLQKLCEKYS